MDKIYRPERPKKDDLKRVYDVFNEIFKDCFYTKEEFEKVKKEKIAIWQKAKRKA